MSKSNRNIIELQDNIDNNFILRRNELGLYKKLVVENSIFSKNLIVFLYAHWEGFIKYCSECFLQFVSNQKIKYKDLNYGLLAVSKLDKIKDFIDANVALKIKAIEELFSDLDKKSEIPYNYAIATYSKLNTETLEEICLIIGIDSDKYSTKKGIIDEQLVNKRNSIAHGELLKITPSDAINVHKQILEILEMFKTDVLNRAVQINNFKNET